MARNANTGKWVVAALIALSLVMALLRWVLVPKTNPRRAEPGNPFHSPEQPSERLSGDKPSV
jgi:hypothetical protein